jgi:SAM-dependent methyltransferase
MAKVKSKDIKDHVNAYIKANAGFFKGKKVIDMPAGTGLTSKTLMEAGAEVYPFDLFPEFFQQKEMSCSYADIMEKLPLDNSFAQALICQEGIEHFENQLYALKEFNRVLVNGGKLIITTPNYSNLRSRFSYLISESEYFSKFMPPNEMESIWMAQSGEPRIYFGHIFLIGIQKLRCLAKLSGFQIEKVQRVRTNKTSVWLLPLYYPFIYLFNYLTYKKALKKLGANPDKNKLQAYKEIFNLAVNVSILTDSHLFVVLKKECDTTEVASHLIGKIDSFNTIT